MTTTSRARTVGLIALHLGEPVSRIRYIVQTRKHIKPIGWAANARLFDSAAVAKIRHEINAIDARRQGGDR